MLFSVLRKVTTCIRLTERREAQRPCNHSSQQLMRHKITYSLLSRACILPSLARPSHWPLIFLCFRSGIFLSMMARLNTLPEMQNAPHSSTNILEFTACCLAGAGCLVLHSKRVVSDMQRSAHGDDTLTVYVLCRCPHDLFHGLRYWCQRCG